VKYYLIAGEASGDLHASNLVKEIKLRDKDALFRAWGGDLMKKEGVEIVKHISELAFMGFAEVLLNLPTILNNLSFCKKDILAFQPDVLILVDYPGFNLRIAKFARAKGIRVNYYISPQIWAWKRSRVHTIKKVVDKMLVILPFEKEFYKQYGLDVEFVGHPLLDAIAGIKAPQDFRLTHQLSNKPIVALLPGSRKQEIKRMLPLMLAASKNFPEYEFVLAGAPSVDPTFYEHFLAGYQTKVVNNQTYSLLLHSSAALVTSGTATLETALLDIPQVVCYRGSTLSYQIAKRLIKVKYISLVNLIMDQYVVTELIQDELTTDELCNQLNRIIHPTNHRKQLLEQYESLRKKLGGQGASAKAAAIIVDGLEASKKLN
jgi:lipid-A-disaccharide synthase